ncbi:MAG: type II toxin-antitoxin system HicB family antitoxin [Bacteroidetes bacterium]|nr:type II toxin-antitoxin system HicB family antitoxin [Bacteroidota bacterium]
MDKSLKLTAVFEPAEEGGFLAYVEEIDGINSQGTTLEEARENLIDAIDLMFEENRSETEKKPNSKKLIRQTLTFTL